MADTTFSSPLTFGAVTGAGLSPNVYISADAYYSRNVERVQRFHQQLGLRSVSIGQQGVLSTRFGNVEDAADFAMTALSSETEVPPTITHTVGYDSVTVAARGLAIADTYDKHMFATQALVEETGIMRLLRDPTAPVLAELLSLVATAVAGISAVSGTTGADLDLDTMLAALANFTQTAVAESRVAPGRPKLMLHSKQVTDLQASARTEPGFQYTGQSMGMQGILDVGAFTENFMGLGVDLYMTDKITTASSAHQGALVDPGTVIVGFGNPAPMAAILSQSMLQHLIIPELGLLLQQDPTTLRQRLATFQLYAYLGAAMGDTNVGRQRRIQSAI